MSEHDIQVIDEQRQRIAELEAALRPFTLKQPGTTHTEKCPCEYCHARTVLNRKEG